MIRVVQLISRFNLARGVLMKMMMNLHTDSVLQSQNVCRMCQKGLSDTEITESDLNSLTTADKCSTWLETSPFDDSESSSVHSFETSDSSTTETCSTKDSESDKNGPIVLNDYVSHNGVNGLDLVNMKFNNIQLSHCDKAHVGNVTNFYGPVYITENKQIVRQQSVTNQVFIDSVSAMPRKLFIMERRRWLAQPPLEDREYLEVPAKYVIISHTATEDGSTQSENILLVRGIQTFHIESMKWSDIAYNFLIGCDGNVYEGRGWNAIGAHTFGYNNISLGIAFVGCFMNKLPPQFVLNQAKSLIKHGVMTGAIDKDYRLLGHCQCRPFESPGRKLYEEIQTWENWYNIEDSESI